MLRGGATNEIGDIPLRTIVSFIVLTGIVSTSICISMTDLTDNDRTVVFAGGGNLTNLCFSKVAQNHVPQKKKISGRRGGDGRTGDCKYHGIYYFRRPFFVFRMEIFGQVACRLATFCIIYMFISGHALDSLRLFH